jgi:hypothetical protein
MPLQPWTKISKANVETRLSGEELASFRKAARTPGEADPLEPIIESVSERVRGSVAGGGKNVGSLGEIPSALLDVALSIIVMRVMTRCAGQVLDPTGQRKADYDDALRVLERVERGEGPAIPEPETNETAAASYVPIAYFAPHEEALRRDQQDGI